MASLSEAYAPSVRDYKSYAWGLGVSLGVVVNREARRFYDEGEDFWPKRYAIWGRLVAMQPGQVGHSIIDAKAIGRFMPPVFKGARADTLEDLARQLSLPVDAFVATGTTPADLDWFVPHQANKRIIEASADKAGIPRSKIVMTVEKSSGWGGWR